MKIEYNQEEKSIILNDGYKQALFMNKALLLVSVFSLTINGWNLYRKDEVDFFLIIMFVLLITVIYALIHTYIKADSSKVLPVESIKIFKKRTIFTNKRYSLQLKNGKYRHLPFLKDVEEVEKLELFIKNNQ